MEEGVKQENIRDQQGRFVPGVSGNPNGRPVETEGQKLEKALREAARERLIGAYIDELAEALPEIRPALVLKAKEGDVPAIREIHDRVFGKPKQNIDVKGDVTSRVVAVDE